MTAIASSNQPLGDEFPHLSLVTDIPPATSFSYSLDPFQPESYSEGSIAMSIGRLVTEASATYRLNMGGKHGYELDAEREVQRRNFAYAIFREFGMLRSSVELDDDAESKKFDEQIKTDFIKNHYDPADKTVAHTPRSELSELVEKRISHPVIRAANSWARVSGESNTNMRTDAILATRAAALILEKIGESEYSEDLEL